jgi:hypothetical protein
MCIGAGAQQDNAGAAGGLGLPGGPDWPQAALRHGPRRRGHGRLWRCLQPVRPPHPSPRESSVLSFMHAFPAKRGKLRRRDNLQDFTLMIHRASGVSIVLLQVCT